jgi:hypothetical protein
MSTYEHVCGACGRPDTPRVWRSGDNEPGEDVRAVMDHAGIVWQRDDGRWSFAEYRVTWPELRGYGPLAEVMLPAPVLW